MVGLCFRSVAFAKRTGRLTLFFASDAFSCMIIIYLAANPRAVQKAGGNCTGKQSTFPPKEAVSLSGLTVACKKQASCLCRCPSKALLPAVMVSASEDCCGHAEHAKGAKDAPYAFVEWSLKDIA